MESAYLLWHTHRDDRLPNNEDVKLIGVYSSEAKANEALDRAKLLSGFRDSPEGFEVSSYKVDKDEWISGFITV